MSPAPRRGNMGRLAGAGAALSSAQLEMAAFDDLPAAVRDALNDAAFAWCAPDILARWRRAAMSYGEDRATRAALRAIRVGDHTFASERVFHIESRSVGA